MKLNIEKRLEKLNIDKDSEVYNMLIKLDSVYDEVETIENQVEFLLDKRKQLIEDCEVMELVIMHKSNKNDRLSKWELKS